MDDAGRRAHEHPARGAGPLRSRSRAVLAAVVVGGLALGTALPTWLSTTVSTALEPTVDIEVTGTSAAPAVGAAALVILAGGVALAIAGRVARWVALVVVALAGALVVASAAGVLLDPVPPATSGASATAGVTELTSPVAVAVWPWLTMLLGALAVVVAVLAGLGSSAWGATSGRHERAGAEPGAGVGIGAVPAGPAAGAEGRPGGLDRDSEPGEPDDPDEPHDPHDAWDALSRGTDPSADR